MSPDPCPLTPVPSRSGITLLEVLVSIFILAVGLLGIAALLPLGKFSLMETEKSDRIGACGRAGLRDVEVRRMLDYQNWRPVVPGTDTTLGAIALDPLGRLGVGIGPLGGASSPIPRYTFIGTLTLPQADAIFRWGDDLPFAQDSTTPDDRPVRVGITSEGNFSWFLTVCPSPSDIELTVPVNLRRNYAVSVVVCYKRDLTAAGENAVAVSGFPGGGYGGGTVVLAGTDPDPNQPINNVKGDQWVMLASNDAAVAKWYRVVGVNRDLSAANTPVSMLSLVGPDWDVNNYGTGTQLVVVDGVAGVYTTSVQLDADCIWTR